MLYVYRQSRLANQERRSVAQQHFTLDHSHNIEHTAQVYQAILFVTYYFIMYTHMHVSISTTWSSYAYSFFFKPVKRNQNYLVITFAVVEVFQNTLAGTE